jgi:hypothetical protein
MPPSNHFSRKWLVLGCTNSTDLEVHRADSQILKNQACLVVHSAPWLAKQGAYELKNVKDQILN